MLLTFGRVQNVCAGCGSLDGSGYMAWVYAHDDVAHQVKSKQINGLNRRPTAAAAGL